MNDGGPSSTPRTAADGRESRRGSTLPRLSRSLTLLLVSVVAALTLPYLLTSPDEGAARWLAPAGALLVLGLALLALRRVIAPELDSLERERRELDEEHQAALRTGQETNEYLRGVTREIQASMQAVLGLTQLLLRSPLDATQHRQMRTIDGASRALLRIINDLLSLSGPDKGRFDFVPMGTSLHDVLHVSLDLLEPAAKDRGVTLSLDIGLEVPDRVLIDIGRVQQIVLGTCRYAIEACAPGRVLRVEAGARKLSDARFELSLHVEGVAPEGESANDVAPPSREPPSVRAASSPPTGLALPRRLVALMGGSLTLSEPAGALELLLPLPRIGYVGNGAGSRGQRPERSLASSAPPPPLLVRLPAASAPILIVEADPTAQRASIELLENLGFDVEVASSAEVALERIAERKYALILLSAELPGTSGYTAAARILGQLGQQRPALIGYTRELDPELRDRAARAGMDALILAPLTRASLCEALAEWLPDEANPASSGTRLSTAGALDQATRRASRLSGAPASSQPDLASGERSPELVASFVHEAPGELRALARAAARSRREDVALLAAHFRLRCASCGALKMAALCRTLEGARDLSLEQLGANVKALGHALDVVLGLLGEQRAPASATIERGPDSP